MATKYKKGSMKGFVWKNPEMNKYDRGFRAVWSSYNANAISRGRDFTMTPIEFEKLISQECFYCGEPPRARKWGNIKEPVVFNGLDRVDNTQGYTKENVVPCCMDCNLAKKSRTSLEFLDHCLKISAYQRGKSLTNKPK